MSISIGDLVRIRTYETKPLRVLSTSGVENLRESPQGEKSVVKSPRGAVSVYFDFEHQGKTGIVTKVTKSNNDDSMWVKPMVTILLGNGSLLKLPKEDVHLLDASEKTHANLAKGYIEE